MEKRAVLLVMILLFTGLTTAAMTLSEPADIYNLGDKVYIATEGLTGTNNGNFNIQLLCGTNTTINLVKLPGRAFSTEKPQSYSLPYKVLDQEDLEVQNLSSIIGNCQIIASIGSQSSASKFFTITDKINVNAKVDKIAYDPGMPITLEVEAIKANGQPLEGSIQAGNAATFVKEITGGKLKEIFSMSETTEPGPYTLELRAYDGGDFGTLNSGTTTITYIINQVPTSIISSMSEETVTPGNNLRIRIEVFDQSGKEMEGLATVRLITPNKEEQEVITKTGEFAEFPFTKNATAGVWKFYVIFENLVEEREFTVEEKPEVEFDITDSVLTIKNIGNVNYNKSIEVMIGQEKKELQLNMKLGEERKFNLKAPQGEYEVSVGEGDNKISRQVLLTGNAISIRDLERVGAVGGYGIVWIFLILILLAGGYLWYRKKNKESYPKQDDDSFVANVKKVGTAVKNTVENNVPRTVRENMGQSVYMSNKSPTVQSLDTNHNTEDKSMKDYTKRNEVKIAESKVEMIGDKYYSAIVAVSIKNYHGLNDNSKTELTRIINKARDIKGLVDWRGDYVFVVFSPIITKTQNNEHLAVKAATAILQELRAHNKRFNNKIEFSVGVHCGELLASKSEGKLKYTSLGNTISFAKRLADSNKEKVLVSEELKRKMLRELKAEKIMDIGNKSVYEVTDIKDKEANENKLKDLLKRIEE